MTSTMSRWTKLLSFSVFSLLLAPPQQALASDFPTATCRTGFIQAGPRLCISKTVQDAARLYTATARCRNQRARVATYGDLYYLYRSTTMDASYNPNGKWLGERQWEASGIDLALRGNRDITTDGDPDQENFEGLSYAKNGVARPYWCAHDDE